MGRKPRLEVAGGYFHVGTRGNNRRLIYTDDVDRRRFLWMVRHVCEAYEWRCYAYCLMTNHYHLVVQTLDETLSAGMEWLNGNYARAFNQRHARRDHLFGRRFFSEYVETNEYLLELVRYVPLNPVRAYLCARPEHWLWSSYRPTAGLGARPRFLACRDVLRLFAEDERIAAARYTTFVEDGIPPRPE